MILDESFKKKVETLVRKIPEGKIMTYGQLAALAGSPRAARVVGGIAHYGDPKLNWHRVVNKKGGLASGYPGGRLSHKELLEAEGYEVFGDEGQFYIDVEKLIYWPEEKN
jgi:methylated-DNA-protein-cysteine methyltransferase-like protein